jgi:serine phosphatase RsbU (regulator of sigma subunit)
MATVVIGVADEPYETWRFSSAGHYPPLVGGEGEPARQAEMEIDRLIGADPEAERHSTSIELPPGGYLCVFTDGLVERRPSDGDGEDDLVAANIARVAEALVDFGDPEMGCIRVLTEVVGDADPEDDIAVLIAQRVAAGTAP